MTHFGHKRYEKSVLIFKHDCQQTSGNFFFDVGVEKVDRFTNLCFYGYYTNMPLRFRSFEYIIIKRLMQESSVLN